MPQPEIEINAKENAFNLRERERGGGVRRGQRGRGLFEDQPTVSASHPPLSPSHAAPIHPPQATN